ncbi:MAG: NAD(P)H-quinone oxidoreductase [Thermoanaerobaculia bacterium]|nr:NAD(P)H-quinone oxidoreductase [Thermoanaerobaculia bacterium]MBP9825417.1 NAD(P)H-quinone oxidoreductase [Thermoanaerobaculia bacterium]
MLAVLPWRLEISGAIAVGEVPAPEPGPGEVRLRVAAAGLNRADLLQMRGQYPPPPGASSIPGLECAGVVDRLGDGVEGFRIGDRVMALLAGGGQGEWVAVPAGQLLPVPTNLTLEEAAAIPEAALTAWTNLVVEGELRAGETVLVTGATSGIGTFAVQLIRALGGKVVAAARSAERLERLRDFGVEHLVPFDADYPKRVRAATGGSGVDLVLDLVAGEWLPPTLDCMAERGRLVLVGLTAGRKVELDLSVILKRRLRIVGSVLRARPVAEKSALVRGFAEFGLPRLADGRLRPVVDRLFPLAEAARAYAHLEHERPLGKVLLTVPPAV